MSDFDPFRLYQKHYKKSYSGQVIRKKPTENIYAYNQKDLSKAIQIVESYGYSIYKSMPPAAVSIYGGSIHNDSISYTNLVNSSLKAGLIRYNPDIFSKIYENFKLFININSVQLVHTPQALSNRMIEFNLVDGTSYEQNVGTSQSFTVTPLSSSTLRFTIQTSTGSINRGLTENYNNGLVYEELYDRSLYEAFLNNDYSDIPEVVLGELTSSQQHDTYWQYTATIILN